MCERYLQDQTFKREQNNNNNEQEGVISWDRVCTSSGVKGTVMYCMGLSVLTGSSLGKREPARGSSLKNTQ